MALIHYYAYILLGLPTVVIIFIIYFARRYIPDKKKLVRETGALNVKGPTRDEEILDRAPLSVAEICFNLIFIKDVKFIITR
jgi:ABC-type arginine transport system permease subunit